MPTSAAKEVLFILPHQDDECGVSTRIDREHRVGHRVHCVYLTDGAGHGVAPTVRDDETRRVFAELGLGDLTLDFFGSREGLSDGTLPEQMEFALDYLEKAFERVPLRRIYCLAYEGGHQDHDAAHLVTVVFALRRGLLRRTWQMPMYNGRRAPWRFFRVHDPIPENGRVLSRRLSSREALRHAFLFRHHRSQVRTWIGLGPEHLLQRAVLRRERIQPVSLDRLRARPHRGTLLYEQFFGFTYAHFEALAQRFLREYVAFP